MLEDSKDINMKHLIEHQARLRKLGVAYYFLAGLFALMLAMLVGLSFVVTSEKDNLSFSIFLIINIIAMGFHGYNLKHGINIVLAHLLTIYSLVLFPLGTIFGIIAIQQLSSPSNKEHFKAKQNQVG